MPSASIFDMQLGMSDCVLGCSSVQVGADRIGRKAQTHRPVGNGPQEAAAAVPQIEEDAALPRLEHERLDARVFRSRISTCRSL